MFPITLKASRRDKFDQTVKLGVFAKKLELLNSIKTRDSLRTETAATSLIYRAMRSSSKEGGSAASGSQSKTLPSLMVEQRTNAWQISRPAWGRFGTRSPSYTWLSRLAQAHFREARTRSRIRRAVAALKV